VTFNFFDQRDGLPNAGCTIDDTGHRLCPAYDYATGQASETDFIEISDPFGGQDQWAGGQWTLSLTDLGNPEYDARVALGDCVECENSGAHTNQWVLILSNDGNIPGPMAPQVEWECTDSTDCEACQDCYSECTVELGPPHDQGVCMDEFNQCIFNMEELDGECVPVAG